MGAPEVVNVNALLIRSLLAKKVIDVGVFTGASSLAAALALPEGVNNKNIISDNQLCSDGVVVACDVSEDFTKIAQKYWKEAGVEHKVKLKIAPAADTLNSLLDSGEENTFDFAFIDADKVISARFSRILKIISYFIIDWLRHLLRAVSETSETGRNHCIRQHSVGWKSSGVSNNDKQC